MTEFIIICPRRTTLWTWHMGVAGVNWMWTKNTTIHTASKTLTEISSYVLLIPSFSHIDGHWPPLPGCQEEHFLFCQIITWNSFIASIIRTIISPFIRNNKDITYFSSSLHSPIYFQEHSHEKRFRGSHGTNSDFTYVLYILAMYLTLIHLVPNTSILGPTGNLLEILKFKKNTLKVKI